MGKATLLYLFLLGFALVTIALLVVVPGFNYHIILFTMMGVVGILLKQLSKLA